MKRNSEERGMKWETEETDISTFTQVVNLHKLGKYKGGVFIIN
jgi:hypothetical protein